MIGLVLLAVCVRLYLIAHFNINWDEFFYLSKVYSYLRGELDMRLQTFHVHLFGWLPAVSINEVDQIIAARAVMLALHMVTAWLLYRIARRFTNSSAALLAAVAYLSVSFVIRGGSSFRVDPIAACLSLAAFDLLLRRAEDMWRPALAGLLLSVSAMITIKTAIFLPSLAAILAAPILCEPRRGKSSWRAAATVLTAVAGFAILYAIHAATLGEFTIRPAAEAAAGGFAKTVIESGLFPQLEVLKLTVKWDFVFWVLWIAGAAVLAQQIWRGPQSDRRRWIEGAALALPVLSLAIYRNSFPYYYGFILAPASVLTALAWHALTEQTSLKPGRILPGALKASAMLCFAASLLVHGAYVPSVMPLEHQRTVLAVIHRMFPEPVPYLDRSSFVSSFPQVSFFISTWGIENYLRDRQPVLQTAIEQRQPPLLIANHPLLDIENAVHPTSFLFRPRLLETDREALQETYIHQWGPIYLAGRRVEVLQSGQPVEFDMRVAGRYTLEAGGSVWVDGQLVQPDQAIDLELGTHRVTADTVVGRVTLRWGEALYWPELPPPALPLFLGF